jgi:thymidylate synthase ThyX
MIKVSINEMPTERDWMEVKKRALVTIGKKAVNPPDLEWKKSILKARHSPIRRLFFSFYIECPYWVSVHLSRHIHAQPYIKSQRNDRQNEYDRNDAPQSQMVSMIWDMNAEELMTISNKRLCSKASKETRDVVKMMCDLVKEKFPEFDGSLVPSCVHDGGICYEINSCKEKDDDN